MPPTAAAGGQHPEYGILASTTLGASYWLIHVLLRMESKLSKGKKREKHYGPTVTPSDAHLRRLRDTIILMSTQSSRNIAHG